MKFPLVVNVWVVALSLCLLTFLGYEAIKNQTCLEVSYRALKIGNCEYRY